MISKQFKIVLIIMSLLVFPGFPILILIFTSNGFNEPIDRLPKQLYEDSISEVVNDVWTTGKSEHIKLKNGRIYNLTPYAPHESLVEVVTPGDSIFKPKKSNSIFVKKNNGEITEVKFKRY